MMQKIKDLITYMNERGIPVPMFRDHKVPSVSVTLLILSSILVIAGICRLGNVDVWSALAWFVTNAVIYNNRGAKISKDGIEITNNEHKD